MASISQMLALPAVCILCSQYHRAASAVCSECKSLLKPIKQACRYCALPLPEGNFLVCGACIKEKPSIDRGYAAYLFEEPLRTLLHEFKYQEGLYLRSFLAQLIRDNLKDEFIQTQCLIPVPLHPKRLRQRGFNQAAELAKLLAKQLDLPCELTLCKKIIHTEAQVNLNAKERRRNLRNAFQAQPCPYQHVTLIDDLLTTGSTANELAKVLKAAGASQVDLWCCARAG